MTENITPGEVAASALHWLRTHRWIQGGYDDRDDDGQLTGACLAGALEIACDLRRNTRSEPQPEIAAMSRLADATQEVVLAKITDLYGEDPGSIEDWNDNGNRTFDDVEKVLEKVVADG